MIFFFTFILICIIFYFVFRSDWFARIALGDWYLFLAEKPIILEVEDEEANIVLSVAPIAGSGR